VFQGLSVDVNFARYRYLDNNEQQEELGI